MSTLQGEQHRKHPRPRLETLSDLIYGLSLSIGAISLVITNNQASTASDINRNILEFLFVFLILITSWIIYTSDMSVLPLERRLVTRLGPSRTSGMILSFPFVGRHFSGSWELFPS